MINYYLFIQHKLYYLLLYTFLLNKKIVQMTKYTFTVMPLSWLPVAGKWDEPFIWFHKDKSDILNTFAQMIETVLMNSSYTAINRN